MNRNRRALCLLCGVLAAFGVQASWAAESRIVSWNAWSRQFIDPPVFQFLALPGAVTYRATLESGGARWTVESLKPRLDLATVWSRVPVKKFKLTLSWLDGGGRVLAEETSDRVKAPDWKGLDGPPADWVAAADRDIAWLIRVAESKPYQNLTHWEAQLLLQYLCRHKDDDPSYLPLARKLLRFVEDQFVLFGPESEAHPVPVKGPLVFEQFACWWPMEGHTGYYIQSLLELHKATGETTYLEKAMAAGNAICAQQFEDGSISNWGTRWLENGRPVGTNCGHTWYNTNAIASASLYQLASAIHGEAGRKAANK
jgi:hypothetical protein